MSVLNSEKLPPILKDSVITGLITLVLAVPIVGLPTINATEGLQIEPRWSVVIWMVLAVFLGRLVLNFWWHREQTSSSSTILLNTPFLQSLQQLLKFIIPIGVLFALILPTMPFASRYVMDVAILVITYIMLGWGLNIVVGLAGLLDLGYVAFYAIGAYSYALLANYFDWSFWICLPLAGVFAAISGILLGFPVLRLRGDYLAIVTLGFGEIIRVILLNWYEFTGGPDGISGIPRPSFFGLEFKRSSEGTFSSFFGLDYSSMHRIIFLYYLILALALLTNFITLRLRKLPVGRAWEALREDEIACRSLGINPTNTKLTAFAIGATFGGLAGSFFATRQGFISPESFTFIESAVILAIVVLGGMGSQIGVVLASVVLIGGTELFRELEEYRMLAFGALMVGIMVWKPRGLLAHREPTIRIKTEGSS
ncbi:MAG: high-affinity branched-chain amino acid ABC transporter permease LivM [bacterium]|jgi:branched-chain amino acid transport system permease protein|nr:high-affinity branched-chain amino acid ABC transporter permease LivM [Pseudomonadota bacterium]